MRKARPAKVSETESLSSPAVAVFARKVKKRACSPIWTAASAPKARFASFSPARSPVPWRFTKMPPKDDRPTSRWTRATAKLFAERSRAPLSGSNAASVCMFMTPRFQAPTFPDIRAPPMIPTGCPAWSPIRRLKNRSTSCGAPNWKVEAFSRKNGLFSGKNNGKRVRLICWSSASTCAKSVFAVMSTVRFGVTPHFTSSPRSKVFRERFPEAAASGFRVASPSANGVTRRSRRRGRSRPEIFRASETR